MKRFALLAASLVVCSGTLAVAQETAPAKSPGKQTAPAPTLKVGDAAPALAVTNWVKGDAVTGFEKGRPYVVEFWATWCGPCIQAMPHLTELQREYKDKGLVIIGVSSKDSNGNDLESVTKMVGEKGEGMGYTVAFDANRATSDAYMKASGQRGIPCSFVIDKNSRIAYIGHPMFLDPVLEKVVAGTWDHAADAPKVEAMQKEFFGIYQAEGPEDMLKKIAAFERSQPKMAKQLLPMKYQAQVETGDGAAAAATGRTIVDNAVASKDSGTLNQIAWGIVDPEGEMTNKDLDLAMRAATEANRLSGDKDGAILDTLARVYFLKGDKAKAIATQERAIANAKGAMKADLEATLEEYKGKN